MRHYCIATHGQTLTCVNGCNNCEIFPPPQKQRSYAFLPDVNLYSQDILFAMLLNHPRLPEILALDGSQKVNGHAHKSSLLIGNQLTGCRMSPQGLGPILHPATSQGDIPSVVTCKSLPGTHWMQKFLMNIHDMS